MTRRLKWVSVLIIVFLLAIDVLQVAGLYSNYKEQENQYERSLTNALGDATSMYQYYYLQKPGKKQSTFYIVSGDSVHHSAQLNHKNKIIFSGPIQLDSIEGGLGYSQLKQMQNRHRFDLAVF